MIEFSRGGSGPGSRPGSRSFAETVTPAPAVEASWAQDVAASVFGVTGAVTALGSQHDANLLVEASDGRRLLLKVAHPSTRVDELTAQSLAASRVADSGAGIAAPRTHSALDGALVSSVPAPAPAPSSGASGEASGGDGPGAPLAPGGPRAPGGTLLVRLLVFVAGTPLSGDRYLAPAVVAQLGTYAARSVLALAGFEHPGTHRDLEWDLRNAGRLVDDLLPAVPDAALTARLGSAISASADALARVSALPLQVIHGDITDDNVVARAPRPGARPEPCGIIDFGDVMLSWAVAELAVTCSSVLHHHGASPTSILPAVRAFQALRPLSADEADALWPLVVARAATLVVSAHHAAAVDPGNEYTRANAAHEHRIFEVATSVPPGVMTELVRQAAGFAPTPPPALPAAAHPLLPGLAATAVRLLDLSSTSSALDRGLFAAPGAERLAATQALSAAPGGGGAAMTRFGERRLTRSFRESAAPHPCAALGIEVTFAEPGQAVQAPWTGTVQRAPGRAPVRLTAAGLTLELTGLTAPADSHAPHGPAEAVQAGDLLGATLDGTPLGIRLIADGVDPDDVPWFTTAELLPGWLAFALDPTRLVAAGDNSNGSDSQTSQQPRQIEPRSTSRLRNRTTPDAAALVLRRERHLAAVQEHYFADPPEIERGWRHHLFDTDARPYLDMVNNVAAAGHAHPRIADAVSRQLNLLNTNSRFNYAAIAEFSERLAGLLPDPLDTVFLVNSGTEAVDLALRISWAWSGRRDVVAVREAYHGWSDAADAVSTSVADNPQALETRPPWVHTLDAPNAYRGRHRGAEAHRYAADAVSAIDRLRAEGRPPATFIAEPFYGNAGGMPLPDGYLQAVYPAIRAAGGLCIADEVQVGYGRLGEHFWGFEQQGVLPDIVTVAKAMGNGHPLGAVITSRAIADRYRSQGYFFSSAGGSPVSSVVGTTVLDILADEGLQQNARVVGAHLKARLEALAGKHQLIGAVHGLGLYLGVELVRDRETREPAVEETALICERMRELGVIVQPTSDRQCVLKIKPPMTLTVESADFFADALDTALTHGW